MAYYIKKDNKEKKEEQKPQNPHDTRERRFLFQLVGCAIVLVAAAIIWAIRN